jgi:hypothetical protein
LVDASSCLQLPIDGYFTAYLLRSNLLKTNDVTLASGLQFAFLHLQEIVVIIFALLAALVVLVAVTFISSIDFSKGRRH